MKILVVEDNIKLNDKICMALKMEGYLMFRAREKSEALATFRKEHPDIVLLDIMLPDGQGHQMIHAFKEEYDCWVIMMTALSDTDSKRLSYESGADDYMTKPFDLFELIYKINAIKKTLEKGKSRFTLGDLIVDEKEYAIICGENTMRVPPSHIVLLRKLYTKYKEGSFLDKSELGNANISGLEDYNSIQTFVSRVRKNLIYVGCQHVSIASIYGKGYSIVINEDMRC